jgi:maltose O-acetyltransferase
MGSVASFRDDLTNRVIRYPSAIAIRIRVARLRLLGMKIGQKCWIRHIRVPRNPWDIVIDDSVALDDEVVLLTTGARKASPRLHIGKGTYVNRFTMFDASDSIQIGARCMIGPFCYITDHDHGFDKERPISDQPLVEAPVKVGNNVWIGAHAIILKGVNIGDDAVIAAGAVVRANVEHGQRVAGVPARVLARRRRNVGMEIGALPYTQEAGSEPF